jgi:CRISPR-associated endonuclease/helicase Cas3
MQADRHCYVAHRNDENRVQTVREHAENTAALSRDFAIEELKKLTYSLGLLHDIGKYLDAFQRHIQGSPQRVEHSICGAKEVGVLWEKSPAALLAQLCIAGHHTGIPDGGSQSEAALSIRLKRPCGDYSAYREELYIEQPDGEALTHLLMQGLDPKDSGCKEKLAERFAFFVRYCFSCLTDADSLDTMNFMGTLPKDTLFADFEACRQRLEAQLRSFEAATPLQKARATLQKQAFLNIQQDGEIYLMNMPTGSGKTLAGMECALLRAAKGKKRIIYVIPYNSIIDQTVDVFENLFGQQGQILRHQSSFSYEDIEDADEDYRRSAMCACENWDAPIIITTAVQFFESLYGHKRGKLRKVHNLAESVIVMDEAHLMPVEYLQPCLRGIAYVTRFLHSEAIFLTATMPDFRSLMERYAMPDCQIVDLVPDRTDFSCFQKNQYHDMGVQPEEAVVYQAQQYPSALVVVNSRKTAQAMYALGGGEVYHLSTYMTGRDRKRIIDRIRDRLALQQKDFPEGVEVPPDRRILVVSTSLIEAGVDLDFSAAFRELNGLDNILQTGGRCNREGRRKKGDVYIFAREDSAHKQSIEQNICRGIMNEFSDISHSAAIEEYYRRLFAAKKQAITSHSLGNISIYQIPFRTYSENFHLVDSKTASVVVPQDETCRELVRALRQGVPVSGRKLQKDCCTVYPHELADLLQQGAVQEYGGVYVLENMDYYDPETGVRFQGEDKFV